MGAALRTRLFCFGFRSLPKGLVRPLRLDLLTHLSTADPVEYEQADRRGQVSPLARLVDLCNRLRHRCTLGLCDILQNVPERIFERDAGLASIDYDGALGGWRFPVSPSTDRHGVANHLALYRAGALIVREPG